MDVIIIYIKSLGWILLSILGAILLYGIIALLGSVIPVKAEQLTPENPVEIYIWGNGVHTDLVLPVRTQQVDWKDVFAKDDPGISYSFRYVAIGWGNKDFYLNTPTWADLSVRTALQAVTGLGESVYHLSWYRSMYEDEDSRKLTLSAGQYEQLVEYIQSYLKKDEEGQVIPVQSTVEYGKYHRFYEAKGHYSMFFTCNTFTNNALKKMRTTCLPVDSV
ncbi:MAG: TIGR02117 family protein [Tannerellaceae bacterium]|nr:TIGR02117 family protein [Tannerellaceae bacterium]